MDTHPEIEVSLEREVTDAGPILCAKVSAPTWELNVRAESAAFLRLGEIRATHWAGRSTLQVGRSAGAPAHWWCERDRVTVALGQDDDTGDLAMEMPVAVVDDLVAQVAALAAGSEV